MKLLLFLCAFMLTSLGGLSQIISQFDWDSNPVTTATVGPNAISVSSSAVSDAGGVGGTNGLNPSLVGTPKLDINFTLADSSLFDVAGIDFSIDYHREESSARFFTRGASLIIGAGNQFNVSYRVDNGAGGFSTVSSGNVFPIPNDDTYRNYRFFYLPTTGEGFLFVDGVQIWTNDGPDNRNMYWVGAGNIIIGQSLDGSGNNDTHLDNLIIGSVISSALPIQLVEFKVTAQPKSKTALVEWTTASEVNNDYFELEKSTDGDQWSKLATIDGAGTSSLEIKYQYVDAVQEPGSYYYRLKQIDFDGQLEVFEPVRVDYFELMMAMSEFKVFPNPTDQMLTISLDYLSNKEISIYSASGQLMTNIIVGDVEQTYIELNVSNYPAGLYFASDGNTTVQFVKK